MKSKLLKNKRGVTRENFLFLYITIFVALGTILPFVNAAFGNDVTNFNTEGLPNSAEETDTQNLDGGDILLSILKMFFFTFGDVPFWIDMVFIIFRIHGLVILISYLPFFG